MIFRHSVHKIPYRTTILPTIYYQRTSWCNNEYWTLHIVFEFLRYEMRLTFKNKEFDIHE